MASSVTAGECGATRLSDVPGFGGRTNDLAFFPVPAQNGGDEPPKTRRYVLFFGGDVQDWKENMEAHRDNRMHVEWHLEATGSLMSTKFPEARGVFVVHPARMTLKTFSCYDNFVPSSPEGSPQHVPHCNALNHLSLLLDSALKMLSMEEDPENPSRLILVGFSKGCVVLNQLAREIHEKKDPEIISRIVAMYWLDGGHSGGGDTWVTDANVLRSLVESGIYLQADVTPYQVNNPNKPWQNKEERQFTLHLKKTTGLDATKFKRTLHFGDQELSLNNHFNVLKVFK